MRKLGRLMTMGSLSIGVLVLAATSWAQARPPIAEQIAKPMALIRGGKSKRSAIRGTHSFPESTFLEHGPGNPKLAALPSREKTKTASR